MSQPGENTLLRRQKIYDEYTRVLATYGPEIAPKLSRKVICTEVADNLNYSIEYVRKVTASFLKKKK